MWVKSNCRRLLLQNRKALFLSSTIIEFKRIDTILSFDDKYYNITNYIVMYTCKMTS